MSLGRDGQQMVNLEIRWEFGVECLGQYNTRLSSPNSRLNSLLLKRDAVKRGEGGKCGAEGPSENATIKIALSNMTSIKCTQVEFLTLGKSS